MRFSRGYAANDRMRAIVRLEHLDLEAFLMGLAATFMSMSPIQTLLQLYWS